MLKRLLQGKREEGTFAADRHHQQDAQRQTVIALLAGVAVFGWLYVLFGSGIFRITHIETGELVYLDRGEVLRETLNAMDEQGTWPWEWRNALLIDTDAVAKALQKKLYADSVAVEKSYPNILRLKIKERQSSVVVIANDELYLVDRKGIGSKRITNEEEAQILQRINKPTASDKDLPILRIDAPVEFELGKPFAEPQVVERWLRTFNGLQDQGFGYRNASVEFTTSTKLILNLFEPYDAYFDLLAPVEPQVVSFYAFQKAKKPQMKIEQYVDVRVPGKVYYK